MTFIHPHNLERILHSNRPGLSLHILLSPSLLWDLPACRDGEFWPPLLLGGRLSLLVASFRCPAIPEKEWVSLRNSRMKFQKAHLVADPKPHSPKKHFQ